jgi:AcrR family transcriptional regulator
MTEPVKARRAYDATRRREAARRSRRTVLEAAQRLFLERGFAATTMVDVAGAAGVSTKNLYKVFGNKVGLAKAVFDVAIAGDDEPVPIMERSWVAAIRTEPDAAEKLRMYADRLPATMARVAPILLLTRSATALDPDIAALWQQLQAERVTGMAAFAADLVGTGQLGADVTVEVARDLLWTLNAVEIYELLVLERNWTPDRYRQFVAEALIAALVRRPA